MNCGFRAPPRATHEAHCPTMNDHHLTALADERRRELLRSLLTESPRRVDVRPEESLERALSLYHVHLPRLERSGLVRWDDETHRVSRGPEYREVEPLLEFLATEELVASD